MKKLVYLIVSCLVWHPVYAEEPEDLFGALSGLYWCLKKETPTSFEQIDSAFGFELPASATKASFDDWYKNVSLTVENEELLVTRKLDKTSKKSTVNCESVSSTN